MYNLNNLHQSQPYSASECVMVGNGNSVPIAHTGKGLLPTPSSQFSLSPFLHVPSMSHNLISVSQFAKDNYCSLIFDYDGFLI